MNEEKQRIAIAEACGWQRFCPEKDPNYWYKPRWREVVITNKLPDYLSDLNAMHEAEKTLTDGQKMDYAEFMDDFIVPSITYNQYNLWSGVFEAMHTPASLRAEVFLRTIGKWEEA